MKQIALISGLLLGLTAQSAPAQATYPSGKAVDCYCTNTQGHRVELGQVICMQIGDRLFQAQCQMSLNVPMWREVQQGCQTSALDGDADGGQNLLQSFAVHTHI
ncbi:hypothetical protein [Sulfitobacter sp. CW3]|jgi:hypothetical protein|uniref:hypothetical protein n=1 Tax=Sulfitobacter sp. CW3 TaxID=2861965 RepID=UPI001C5F9E32|nr:hypothetical protein [Sulfitobacter sp. CW3]MBW4960948.1 hypothetical protein [Sulfitobacter sp. CW3]